MYSCEYSRAHRPEFIGDDPQVVEVGVLDGNRQRRKRQVGDFQLAVREADLRY